MKNFNLNLISFNLVFQSHQSTIKKNLTVIDVRICSSTFIFKPLIPPCNLAQADHCCFITCKTGFSASAFPMPKSNIWHLKHTLDKVTV